MEIHPVRAPILSPSKKNHGSGWLKENELIASQFATWYLKGNNGKWRSTFDGLIPHWFEDLNHPKQWVPYCMKQSWTRYPLITSPKPTPCAHNSCWTHSHQARFWKSWRFRKHIYLPDGIWLGPCCLQELFWSVEFFPILPSPLRNKYSYKQIKYLKNTIESPSWGRLAADNHFILQWRASWLITVTVAS